MSPLEELPTQSGGTHVVVLRRANGRYVKHAVRRSKYAAKQIVKAWEARYDESYYVEMRRNGTVPQEGQADE